MHACKSWLFWESNYIRHNKCKERILIGQLAIGERQQKASMVKLRQIAKISSLVRWKMHR